jgi:CPA1 family monovalent cation:H+ antiporter
MDLFNIMAILITLSVIFGYANHRFIELPSTIGLTLISILMSLVLFLLFLLGNIGIEKHWMMLVRRI